MSPPSEPAPTDRPRPPPLRRRPQSAAPARDAATAAQAQAARPDVSVWVSANAGSGKTRVLTNRVARLLLTGVDPGRILCLTFTKAAAAEMQNRLFKTLGEWSMAADDALAAALTDLFAEDEPSPAPDLLSTARKLFARALETPGGLKIQTIHAFCEQLLGRFPLEAGVSPHFQVLDDADQDRLIAEAFDRVALRRGEDAALDAAARSVLSVVAEETFWALASELIAKRRLYEAARDPRARAETLAALLGVDDPRADDAEPGRAYMAAWAEGIDRALLRRLADAVAADATKEAQKRAPLLAAAAAAPTPDMLLDALRAGLLTKSDTPPMRGFPSKGLESEHPWALQPINVLQQSAIAALEGMRARARLAASLELARVADALLAAYAELKAAAPALDFDDLVVRAADLLTRAEARDWVRYKLDGGVAHVLVDEAQDTSPEQWRVIRALTEEFFAGDGARDGVDGGRGAEPTGPRTVFAVGDEKQSIYSFQGAAPKLFGEAGDAFSAAAAGADKTFLRQGLATSFRSTPAVLGFVDAVFAPEGARAGVTFDGAAVAHRAFRAADAGSVEIWPLLEPRERADDPPWDQPVDAPPRDDPTARLADLVAETIAGWIGREPLPARGRRMRAGDVLVLVRKRGALQNGIIRGLKARGAAVAGRDRIRLSDQIEVKDLLALARACLFPEDDLSVAEVLRSPLCDVDEDALFDLAYPRRRGRPLYYELIERRGDRPAYGQAAAFLEAMIQEADFRRPFELFSAALGPRGGRRRILTRLGAEAEDALDEFIARALAFETAGAPTLEAFMGWLRARDVEIKREQDQNRDEVRVMTVHGAKGLEAPVVVMPDTASAPGGGRDSKLFDPECDGAPAVWAERKETDPAALKDLRAQRAEREQEEHRRLLYVALTRAEDRLLICGARGARKAPNDSWHALCAEAAEALGAERIASPIVGARGRVEVGWLLQRGDAKPLEEQRIAAPTEPPRPGWLTQPAPRETAPKDVAPSRLGGEEPAPVRDGGGARDPAAWIDPRRRGVLAHLLLERLPGSPDPQRDGATLLAREAGDLPERAREAVLREALGVLESPALAWMFGPDTRAELPVSAILPELGPGETHGVIDRLAVRNDRVDVIDFKTGAPPPATPEVYARQLGVYAAAIAPLFPGKTVYGQLVWTEGAAGAPSVDELSPDALSAAFHRAAAHLSEA